MQYIIKANDKLEIDISNNDNYEFILEDNAYLKITHKYKEESMNKTIDINLNGINSKVEYFLGTLTNVNNTFTLNVNHNNKNTVSKVINHGVVLNDSKLEFIVNATVIKGNTGSILDQESRIITMDKNNSIIKPNLYVDEFDVVARHAATIGKFNNEDIFYLMTKGLSKDDAYKLLINGFLGGIYE